MIDTLFLGTGCLSLLEDIHADLMKFAAFMAVWFITFFLILLVLFSNHCIYGCVFCVLLFDFVIVCSYCYVYVSLLLLCMFRSGCSVSLCSVYCLCVNVYCTTATGCQPNCS